MITVVKERDRNFITLSSDVYSTVNGDWFHKVPRRNQCFTSLFSKLDGTNIYLGTRLMARFGRRLSYLNSLGSDLLTPILVRPPPVSRGEG